MNLLAFPQIPLFFLGIIAILIFLMARFLRIGNVGMALITASSFLCVFLYLIYEDSILHVLETVFPNFRDTLGSTFPAGAFSSNDPGSILICVVACGLAFVIALYCAEYLMLDRRQHAFYPLLILMICGLMGMLFSENLMILYLFCELMSICTYALVAFRRNTDTAIEAGVKYLVMGSVASVILLLGIALVFQVTGTVNLEEINSPHNFLVQIALIMFLASFSLKSAFVPLHTWLPDAHGRAPSSISAILSGILVQGVFYTMLRVCLTLGFGRSILGNILICMALLNILVGNLMGLVQTYTKRLLGYSTIAQMGYIGLCFAIGLRTQSTLALQSGFFLIVAHAIAKSLAFLVKGVFHYYLSATEMSDLRQAGRLPAFFSLAFGVSILSLAAIPPFPGFMGKWTFLTSTFTQVDGWSLVSTFALLAGSLISLGYYFKLLYNLFFRSLSERSEEDLPRQQKVSIWMYLPIAVLVLLIFFITINPQSILNGSENASQFLIGLMR